jgi:6-phosphogluconolactonase (cycloisomerase 2 family)
MLVKYANFRHYVLAGAVVFLPAILLWTGCGPTNGLPPLTGEFAYVANSHDGVISEFQINTATGALTFLNSVSPPVTPAAIIGMAVHPSNEFLYLGDYASGAYGFDIGDGSFSGLIFGRNSFIPAATGQFQVAIDPSSQACAYVTNVISGPAISRYSINLKNGVLTAVGTTTGGNEPVGIALTPKSGLTLLVVNQKDGSVGSYVQKGAPSCSLTALGTLPLPGAAAGHSVPIFVRFNPLTFRNPVAPRDFFNVAYVTDDGINQAVQELRVDAITGTVTLLGSVSPGLGTLAQTPALVSLAVHPSGNFVYTGTGDFLPGAISLFTVDPATGLLTWVSNTSAGLDSPVSLAIEPSGKYLYAANLDASNVTEFSINAATGALTLIGTVSSEQPANPVSGPVYIVTTN